MFLVRLDIRDIDGELKPDESKSTCGYSSLSLIIFALVFFGMLAVVYGLLFRSLKICIPPAEHCSLVISAACHPPPDVVDADWEKVQWGVVCNRFGGDIGHCSFASEEIS
jgi:hypothetical protein